MAGAWTTLSILDGGGASRTMRVWDESGTGAGPFSFGNVIGDESGSRAILGSQVDAANMATDTTAVSAQSVWKQISKTLQAAASAVATAFFAKVTDGTNTAAVKAASTAPSATDPALVVAISPNSVNTNGRKTPANSAPVVEASRAYQDIAASQTNVALTGGGGGATGDWLEGVLIIPETTAAGTVSLKDGSGSAVNIFLTGTLSNLVPFYVPMGCQSSAGAWSITTGANVHIRAFGNFT